LGGARELKKCLSSVGSAFREVVSVGVFLTDASGPGAAGVFRGSHLTSTTVEVVRLATDLRCKIEINAEAVTD